MCKLKLFFLEQSAFIKSFNSIKLKIKIYEKNRRGNVKFQIRWAIILEVSK